MKYTTRTLENFFLKASSQFPVLLLTGARQVGKTTMLHSLKERQRTYITLDDPLLARLAKEDPALFMQRFPPPVIIDEIQYAPGLMPHIKMEVDRTRTPGMYWLTGSQHFSLMRDVSETLAGRVGIVQLLGLSQHEFHGRGGTSQPFVPRSQSSRAPNKREEATLMPDIYKSIWRGSFPAVMLSQDLDRDLFYSSYVQTYLQRDVHALTRVGDEFSFLKFLRATAASSAQLLNLSDLARDADIAPNTAKSWLSILRASGIVYLLEPYFVNATKRLVKTPKLYFLDTGLCSWLTEWSSPETLSSGAMTGAIFETWVVGEILKTWLHNGKRAPLYYYRDRDKKEIDLLIVQDGQMHPVEIKRTASPSQDAIRQFRVLENLDIPVGHGALICLIRRSIPLSEHVTALPADHI